MYILDYSPIKFEYIHFWLVYISLLFYSRLEITKDRSFYSHFDNGTFLELFYLATFMHFCSIYTVWFVVIFSLKCNKQIFSRNFLIGFENGLWDLEFTKLEGQFIWKLEISECICSQYKEIYVFIMLLNHEIKFFRNLEKGIPLNVTFKRNWLCSIIMCFF